ncbi:MAG: PAS domain-containing protein, partial [Phycisphaerales bacterium]
QAVRLRDGSEVYGEWQFTRLVDEAGQFVGIVAIVHDHTDRRRAEQIIERDRHLFMSGPVVGVRWLPMPGWPVDFVTQNIDRFGYSPEQFGLNRLMFADLVHPDDLPRILGEVTSYIAAGASSFTQQYRFRDASGQYRWLEDITIVVRDDTGAVKHLDGFLTDATQRINAELALARSRERYEKLVNTIEGIVWEGNPESGRLTFMSNQSEWILGFPADRFVNEPGFWNSRIHPEDRDWIREFCLEQSRLKRDHQLEFRAIDADGSLVWLRNYVTVVDEPDHSYLRGIIVDITKLKHTEAALAQSREQLERAQAVAHVGSWIWDLDGSDRLTWSRQTFRIFGVDESAFTGHESFFVNMLFPEDRPAVRAAFAAAYDGGPRYSVDHRIIRADGQVRWVHQEADIVWNADGSPRQAIGVVKDITEHRAAIEALQASEARFRRVAESNLIGLCFCDAHGVITYANRVFHDMLGHSHADGSAARLNWPDLSPPDDRAADEEAFAELKRTGHSRVYAKELLRRDGSRVPVLVGMAYLDDSRSQVVRFVLDITDRRHAEQWQSFMMAELDHRVKNNMAAVLTLAEQTLRSDLPAVEAGKVLLGRLRALARTHGALAHTHWQGARLLPLAQHALEAFRGVDLHDIRIEGDDVLLPSRVATVLAMALHELATNALKYGALSVPDGRILLRWHIADPDAARTLHLLWEESGGPVVAAPRRRGFGRELIEGGITYECHGSVSLQFLPTGVRCHVQVPLADPSQHRIITRPRDLSPHRL